MGKLKNISNRIRSGIADMRAFGVYVGLTNMLWPIIAYSPQALKSAVMTRKKQIIDALLLKTCADTIQRYSLAGQSSVTPCNTTEVPIFVCWLQGLAEAPDLVRACIRSVERHSVGHPMHVVTADNYSQWVELPVRVIHAWQEGYISNANFADILRVALLAKYGGCWIDATIWLSDDLKQEIFEKSFYSCRYAPDGIYITDNKWSNFFLATRPQSVTIRFVRDMLLEYMEQELRFVDYFLMDYIIRWGYDHIDDVREEIDAIPYNNRRVHDLIRMLEREENSDGIQDLFADTYIHKLSWRIQTDQFPKGSIGKTIVSE